MTTVREMKTIARNAGLTGYSYLNKAGLIWLLKANLYYIPAASGNIH